VAPVKGPAPDSEVAFRPPPVVLIAREPAPPVKVRPVVDVKVPNAGFAPVDPIKTWPFVPTVRDATALVTPATITPC
jgi:hypothetical protein